MPYPARLIFDSDLSSTPAPLQGGVSLVLTTPANVYAPAFQPVYFESSVTFGEQFDTVDYILTCDENPEIIVYNGYISEDFVHFDFATIFASVVIEGRTVKLIATVASADGGTFEPSRTFRATVIPTKSPFSAS